MISRRGVSAGIAAWALVALALVGCSPSSESHPDLPALVVGDPLPEAEVDDLLLPYAFQELSAFTLPFDALPQEVDGVILGLHESAGELQFTAVSTDGTVLWSESRPPTCSGYAVTFADGTALAVLTDVGSTDSAISQTTASAYDLHTGALRWGPVDVPGPWHGPGTVFAPAAPASAMGETGSRLALDPATGAPLDLDGEVIGEFGGVLLTQSGAHIHAEGAAHWQLPVADLAGGSNSATVRALPGAHVPLGYALLTVNDAPTGSLVRLSGGSVVADGVTSAVWDPAAEILLIAGEEWLAGYGVIENQEFEQVWKRPIRADLTLTASGGVLAYLRSDTAVQVINAVTGADAVGYAPEATQYAVPFLITADGAAVFSLDEFTLMGTHPGP